MNIKEFFYIFIKSLNPIEYNVLVQRKKREAFSFFAYLVIFSVLLHTLFILPSLPKIGQKTEAEIQKISKFNVTGLDVEASAPIVLLNEPKIVVDLVGEKNITDESVLISRKYIQIKKFRPSLLDLRLYQTESKPISEYSDVKSLVLNSWQILTIFLLPSILFFVMILYLIKYASTFTVFLILSMIFLLLLKKKFKFSNLVKIWTFCLSILLLFELFIGKFALLLYASLGFIAIFMQNEKRRDNKDAI